jgi:hypothetical protein
MNPVRPRLVDRPDLIREMTEIGGEDRGRDDDGARFGTIQVDFSLSSDGENETACAGRRSRRALPASMRGE